MSVIKSYNKAFLSNLASDWEAYYAEEREQRANNRSLPRIQIDQKNESPLGDEWEEMRNGEPVNAYAAHWWGR